jgi:hypothetical protein
MVDSIRLSSSHDSCFLLFSVAEVSSIHVMVLMGTSTISLYLIVTFFPLL